MIAGDGDLGMFSVRSRYDLGTISVCSRYLTLSVLGGQATIVTRGTEATPGNCCESRVWCLRILYLYTHVGVESNMNFKIKCGACLTVMRKK